MGLETVMILFFGMVLFGLPVAYAMISISFAYFLLGPIPAFVNVVPQKLFEGIDFIVLTAIPFFLLAGDLMNRSGMTERLFRFANLLVGSIKGGLAYVNVVCSLLFSGLSGVAIGDIAATGKLQIRAMEGNGYSRDFAAAVTSSSALIAPIIPPSGIIIIYCAIMNVSIGAMFLAAIAPGVLMAVGDMLVIFIQARFRDFPVSKVKRSGRELLSSARHASLALLMPVLLIGGIRSGVMTPTEVAALSVLYALVVAAIVYRGLSLRDTVRIFTNSAFESARLLLIIGAAMTMTWIFALENLSGVVAQSLAFAAESPLLLILVINGAFILLGMAIDPSVVLVLFAPVVAPLLYAAGLSPVQVGVMLIMNSVVGLATPPVGNVLFAICAIANLNYGRLLKEIAPFLALKFVLIVLLGLIPALTEAFPALLGYEFNQ